MKEIKANELRDYIKKELCLIDIRPTNEFIDSYLKGAINIILNGKFIERFKHFVHETEVVLIANKDQKESVENELKAITDKEIMICYETVEAWQQASLPMDMIIDVDAYELKLDIKHDERALILDVRDAQDFEEEHVAGAKNLSVFEMTDPLVISQIDENLNIYLHCNGGTRSVLASSILKKHGFHNIRNIEGGMKAIRQEEDIPLKEKKAQIN